MQGWYQSRCSRMKSFYKAIAQISWLLPSVCNKGCCWFLLWSFFIIWGNVRNCKSSCLFFCPPVSIINDYFFLSKVSFIWFSSDTNSSFSAVYLFQCPFSENHWEWFMKLIGDIEHRIDASSFQEPFLEETELSNKMQDSISSGWNRISRLLELSFWKSCLFSLCFLTPSST
jgi:hypothetical protein